MDYNKFQRVKPTDVTYNLDTAMPYGEMPSEALIKKFEETSDLNDGEGQYESYARGTLKDFSPDPITLEQNVRRKDYTAKGILNVLHSGGRGELNNPSHPEMFLELTEREPRGTATDPDFRRLVDQQEARMRFVRFSSDADNSIHQGRPSESEMYHKSRYLVHKQAKARAKIFRTSKDGRREGIRREYYPHVSNVQKTQEDLNKFRPESQTFTDYITDFALNPSRKTVKLSNTIVTDSRLYNQFTTDHEFKVAKYGESTRSRRLLPKVGSVVSDIDGENYDDIPGGEYVPHEDTSKSFKAAGILMGAIVKQKHEQDLNQRGGVADQGNTLETMANRKTQALQNDLNKVIYESQTGIEMKSQVQTIQGKVPTPQRAEHLARVTTGDASKPAHQLHNAELMYKSVKGTDDMDKVRREMITDDRKVPHREELTIFGKNGRTVAATGKRKTESEAIIEGKSLQTVAFKTGRKSSTNTSMKGVAAHTEGFAGKSDYTRVGKTNTATYRNASVNDQIAENQFFNNLAQTISISPLGQDKTSVRRLATASHAIDGIVAQS